MSGSRDVDRTSAIDDPPGIRARGIAVVVFRGGDLLALRRSRCQIVGAGGWEVVSGRCEPNESPIEAARREISEEAGLVAEIDSTPVDHYQIDYAGQPLPIVVFRAEWVSGEVSLSLEHDAFDWCSVDAFALKCPFPRLIEAVRRCQAPL